MATTPSLAMIPSGYKEGKLYSFLPNTDDGDFTFSRGSNATRVNKDGLIEEVGVNVPRLDYTDSSCPSLLLEPMRTNRILYSEDFSQWIKTSGVTITSNYGVSPSGLQNSTRIQLSSANEQLYISTGVHSGNIEVASLYVKGVNGESIQFGVGNNTGQGSVITLNGNWQRITQESTSGSVFIIGNKDATATEFEIYGAQLEEGSYPTSYIPTEGIIKTRLQDECNNAGDSSTFNSEEGVLFFEGSALADDNTVDKRISISDGTNNNRVLINIGNSISNTYTYYYAVSGSNQINSNISVADITVPHKLAVTWKVNEFKIYLDGILNYTDSSGSVNPAGTFTQIQFTDGAGASSFFGKCKDIRVYNTALTDQELAELTTI